MSEVFVSYARSSEADAQRVAHALRSHGFSVWLDQELPGHGTYSDVIEERLRAAKAVVVLWSTDAVKSQWVRAEANAAREAGTLVQVRLGPVRPPLPFNELQCVDLGGWTGRTDLPAWQKIVDSIGALLGTRPADAAPSAPPQAPPLLAVLAFDNLSGDREMGYFSDGVSEDILHTVARSKGLRVIGKASSFQFRGADKTVRRIATELGATHLLDGSVRRAGDRLRITAELVDTATQTTLWTERYDRDLSDIFALQDEIATAIAAALDAHFTPTRNVQAIDPAAYDLFLQARAIYAQDATNADRARCVRLLEETVAIAPDFALAWGHLAMFNGFSLPKTSDEAGDALRPVARRQAERALSIDPECAPAFTALALLLPAFGDYGEKIRLTARAYGFAANEPSVAHCHAGTLLAVGRNRDACRIFDEIVERDPSSPYSLSVRAFFYHAAGDVDAGLVMASEVSRQYPDSTYAKFMLDRLTRITDAIELEPVQRDEGIARLRQRVELARPLVDLAHVGQAARLGLAGPAFDDLIGALSDGRPIAFEVSSHGRGFSRAFTSVALFSKAMQAARHDPRFAEVCVRLGLYDYWRANDVQPDCVGEVAAAYDFMAECEQVAAKLRVGIPTPGEPPSFRPAA